MLPLQDFVKLQFFLHARIYELVVWYWRKAANKINGVFKVSAVQLNLYYVVPSSMTYLFQQCSTFTHHVVSDSSEALTILVRNSDINYRLLHRYAPLIITLIL